jgi:hypothetical protein
MGSGELGEELELRRSREENERRSTFVLNEISSVVRDERGNGGGGQHGHVRVEAGEEGEGGLHSGWQCRVVGSAIA